MTKMFLKKLMLQHILHKQYIQLPKREMIYPLLFLKIYSPADYPQKEYERFKALLESGKREQVITELRILYPKDSYLANLLANRLGIDLEKELGIIYHYQDIDSTTTAQITQDNTIEITTQYDNFHDTLQTIKNATQYRGNLADTLMAGVSGVFGAIDKGLEKLIKNTGDKRLKIAKYIFQSEGISISATYGYGSNDRDIIKTAVSVGLELAGGYFIGLALEGAIVSLGLASIPVWCKSCQWYLQSAGEWGCPLSVLSVCRHIWL